MKRDSAYTKNIIFTVVVAVVAITYLIFNTFFVDIMLPKLSLPMMVLLVAVAEIISSYLKLENTGCIFIRAILGGITFLMLELSVMTVLLGALVFLIVDFIYLFMESRMNSGKRTCLTPLVNGLLLYLAAQGFQGLI